MSTEDVPSRPEGPGPSEDGHGADGPHEDGPDPGLVHPDLASEYLRSLQDGLDRALARGEQLAARVARLEQDRAVLRERLAAARALPRTVTGRIRARLARFRGDQGGPGDQPDQPDQADTTGGAAARDDDTPRGDGPSATAELPGVGRIGPVQWPEPTPTRSVRIALVADEFTSMALAHEAHTLPLHARDGVQVLERERPDLLLVESAYNGPDGTWQRRIARFGEPAQALVDVTAAARDLGIPSVFWNKEDPVNADWFLASAGLFDHVLTVDADMVGSYRRRLGHGRVGVLPFAAQPAIHRPPADPSARSGGILFAGTWFATKHAQRREQMAMLLDPARRRGLCILDRHAGDDERFAWPERFREHIVGSLPYPLAVEATRRFQVVVNVNTVTGSPTMCARRVFELAACATPVVSGPSRAIDELVPSDAIRVVHTAEDAAAAYDELLRDPVAAARMGEAARQWVLDGHTWEHRLGTVLETVGLG